MRVFKQALVKSQEPRSIRRGSGTREVEVDELDEVDEGDELLRGWIALPELPGSSVTGKFGVICLGLTGEDVPSGPAADEHTVAAHARQPDVGSA
jgi:hypothetical protein